MTTSESELIDIAQFREIPIFAKLKPWQVDEIYDAIEPVLIKKGSTLFERGSDDGYTYFLTEGDIELTAEDQHTKLISIEKNDVIAPISNLRPRLFSVKAKLKVTGFKIPDVVFSAFERSPMLSGENDIELESAGDGAQHEFESKLGLQLYRDLHDDKFKLPTLPDLALRIRRAVEDETNDAHNIAKLIEADPAMAAKIVATANSALYGARATTETCAAAVVRLGVNTTQQLVISYSMKEVFKSSAPDQNKRMKALWKHSSNIAALCFVLANRLGGHDPEEALLAGLLHDLGAIAAINYIASMPGVDEDTIDTDAVVNRLKGELGSMILRYWGFTPEHVAAARSAEDWLRDHDGASDLADVVIVAQFHQAIIEGKVGTLPPVDEISALTRVFDGEVTPDTSLEILREVRKQVDQMTALLVS